MLDTIFTKIEVLDSLYLILNSNLVDCIITPVDCIKVRGETDYSLLFYTYHPL